MILKTMLNGIYYSGMQSLCAPVLQGVGSILMLHHVRNEPDREFAPNLHLSISPEFLDITLLRLKQEGYNFVSLDELNAALKQQDFEKYSKPLICVTLDDGYRDNLHNSVSIFKRHEIPFTIYIAPGMIDGLHTLWWEDIEAIIAQRKRIDVELPAGRRTFNTETYDEKDKAFYQLMECLTQEIPQEQQREIVADLSRRYNHDAVSHAKNQMMNWQELKDLAKEPLCTLGAHTMGHFAVGKLNESEAIGEIKNSKDRLEKKISRPVKHFAYPYGDSIAAGVRDFEITKSLGFETAVTTRHGVIYPEHVDHMTALPRISLNGSYQSMHYVRTLLSGVTTRMNNKGRKLNVG